MGQVHSGSTADANFYVLAEKTLERLWDSLGVQAYMWYRDDILLLLSSKLVVPSFVKAITNLANHCYTVTLDVASIYGAPFFDLYVYKRKVASCWQVAWRPYFKPSGRKLSLSSSSAHHPSVHERWPINEIARMYKNSKDLDSFCEAREFLLDCWRAAFMDPFMVSTCLKRRSGGHL